MKSASIGAVASGLLLLTGLTTTPGLSAREFVVKDVKSKTATAPLKLPGGNSVLCGAMVYSDRWGETDANGNYKNPIDAGMFTIEAKPGGALKRLNTNANLIKMRAGVKVNSVYYGISTSDSDTRAYIGTYYTSTWNQSSSQEIDIVNVPSDLTYDPVSGNIYGFFYNDQTQEYDRFCRFDTYYGEATTISTVDRNAFAIAANAKGEIYGIWGYTGWLIKIDPKTGRYEQIGKTGFSPSYINSLTFDDATGKLYWTANAGDGYSALLEVNTSTGVATELMHFENNDSFCGIFAQPYKVPDAAPSSVTDAKVEFNSIGTLQGKVSCTAPMVTHNGSPLAGPLTIAISVNGNPVAEIENVTPGQKIVSDELTFPAGKISVDILAATAQYCGDMTTLETWAGEDIPTAPTEVTLTDVGGVPTLQWKAPQTGKNGGQFDLNKVTYTVVRLTDRTRFEGITATTWKDESFSGNSALSYQVYAVNEQGESEPATSNTLVFAEGYTIPFVEGFPNAAAFKLWTVIDLNGSSTWAYDSKNCNIYYEYGKVTEIEADDWIISPRMTLKAGQSYALTFTARTEYQGYPENFRFMLGRACEPSAMTQLIIQEENYEKPKGESKRVIFKVDEDGTYYLGIYCYSIAKNWKLTLDNIGIAEIDGAVPAAVKNLKVEPAPLGGLKADVSFTVPDVDSKGKVLESNCDVKIYRNDASTPVHTFASSAPGATLNWTDDTMTESALYTYKIVASNEFGDGEEISASAFVGTDVPGAVGNLRASEDKTGVVTLTWDAPTLGANGGYFDASKVTYKIMRSNDAATLAAAHTATTFTDNTLNLSKQTLMYYLVTPYVDSQKGQYANTPLNGVFGPAIATPATETFPAADMKLYPWVSESDGPTYLWSLETNSSAPATADQNGDGGMALFAANESTKGVTGNFSSPKFDISTLAQPELSFWFYHSESDVENPESTAMTLSVMKDGGAFDKVDGVEVKRDADAAGWKRYSVDLTPYKESSYIRLMFTATSDGAGNILLDNISIAEKKGADVELVSIGGAQRTALNCQVPYTVAVVNNDAAPARNVVVTLAVEGLTDHAESTIEEIGAGEMKSVKIPVSFASAGKFSLKATAAMQGDTDMSNNTASIEVTAVEPIVAAPFGLSGTRNADGSVSLTWNNPMERGNVKDDFESYKDWAISGIGEYQTIDRDGAYTYHINKDIEYDDMETPKAFQVCNAKKLGIDIWPEGTPNSGNKMLMSIASIGTPNDDWLISPMLNGKAQTVTIHAKAFTTQDTAPEKMRVLYSDSEVASPIPEEFTLCTGGDITVPDSWSKYTFALPEGTRRFAINCISDDAFALFIDDLEFNDLTVSSQPIREYEVERDGNVLDTAFDCSMLDSEAPTDSSTYRVRARYEDGTVSDWSETVKVMASGISTIEVEDEESRYYNTQGIKVNKSEKGIVIKATSGQKQIK